MELVVQRIVAAFRPVRVILFGSRARGTAETTSDVDLLVVLPEVSDKRQAAVEMRRLLRDLPVTKDIVVTTPDQITRRANLPGNLLRHALGEGRVVYETVSSSQKLPGGYGSPGRTS
ncbi:MAG: nucleotidyltransferase domain-containing protein [Armatimonadota bacterium]|nr:nucleotidyltransferase domain-containing protein [Armatimonadota bacterium]